MSLNKVMLIGYLTADPEMRYTPAGIAVATFSVATNRVWTDQSGQRQEVAEFTRCVAWRKLAEICQQMLAKGKRVFVEGRLQTREWEAKDGTKRRTTEVTLDNMIALSAPIAQITDSGDMADFEKSVKTKPKKEEKQKEISKKVKETKSEDELVPAEDIPF